MKRALLVVFAAVLVITVSALAVQQKRAFPLLDWVGKESAETPRVAILLEFGLKDYSARDWSGHVTVTGARVAHRDGYRFRDDDRLTGEGWEASSHRAVRAPKGNPLISKLEPIATVGVVMHLEDVKPDATLTVTTKKGETSKVQLESVLAGKAVELWNGQAIVRRLSVASGVATGKTEDDFPAAAHGPDGTLWVAYISYTLRDTSRRVESANLKGQPNDFAALYKPGFADQLWLRSFKAGRWGAPIAITGGQEDLARCAVAVNGTGSVQVAYSAHRDGKFNIFSRQLDAQGRLAKEQRVSTREGPDLAPVMSTDPAGDVWIAYQSWDASGQASIHFRKNVGGIWMPPVAGVGGDQGENAWHPAIATAADGKLAIAYDHYHHGSYDIRVRIYEPSVTAVKVHTIAASPKFEARPSLVFDRDGRLWIAYEEGPEKWGKDYGSLDADRGNPLYSARSVRVVCIDTDGKLKRPAGELPTSTVEPPRMAGDALTTARFEKASRWAFPKIGLDGKGGVWLTYRRNFGSRYSSLAGSYWLTFARRLDGDRWSEEIELQHSDGLLDSRPALVPDASGGLTVIHNSDGRYSTPEQLDNQVYRSVVDLAGAPVPPKLIEHPVDGMKDPPAAFVAEQKAVARMRKHRIEAGSRTYQLLRGEFHRHTEISWDGGADGALEDMFRYAIDAVAFDWIGNGDHDNGAGREYPWWLTQKYTAAYHVAGAFTPMFTYERSVAYPHGHRNVMFAHRGVLTLPRLAAGGEKAVGGVHPDDTKMLYRYLREHDGICAVHTSATGMGTDWRDNDPGAEPIVEIYQGDRMSYEQEGAPRAGYDPKTGELPANIAGWYPKGFINHALDKGYKLGFQASSDHWSTHISFFIVLAEKHDRSGLLDAIKQRHCYGATDNILVDFRCGTRIMGDALTTDKAPTFTLHVAGTADLAKVELLRDSTVIAKLPVKGPEFKGEFTDPEPAAGTHYYYARVLQRDGEVAWASPIWVELKK